MLNGILPGKMEPLIIIFIYDQNKTFVARSRAFSAIVQGISIMVGLEFTAFPSLPEHYSIQFSSARILPIHADTLSVYFPAKQKAPEKLSDYSTAVNLPNENYGIYKNRSGC